MKKDNLLLYIGAAALIYFLLRKKKQSTTAAQRQSGTSGNTAYFASGSGLLPSQMRKIKSDVKKDVEGLKFNVFPDEWASEKNQYQSDINQCKI
jgi:hypothetical protein